MVLKWGPTSVEGLSQEHRHRYVQELYILVDVCDIYINHTDELGDVRLNANIDKLEKQLEELLAH